MTAAATIYRGTVSHTRLRPRPHRLRYSVFSILVDVDRLVEIDRDNRLFSYNRAGVFSFHDRDFGPRDGRPIADHARGLLRDAGFAPHDWTISLLAYPRYLGYVFNPLSVYYCVDTGGELRAMIYEVTNTFGERRCYVIASGGEENGVFAHACRKEMYVSPFASLNGRYGFRITRPGDDITVGVQFRDEVGPLVKTHFRGDAMPFSDASLLRVAFAYPFMTLKVMAGIHIEALRLWLKKIPVIRRRHAPRFAVSGPVEAERRVARG